MSVDELPPRSVALPFGDQLQPMPHQHVGNGLVGYVVPQVGEGPDDPVVAPPAILPGEAQDELRDVRGISGLPCLRGRMPDESNFCVTSRRYQRMSVSGFTMPMTCAYPDATTRGQFPVLPLAEQESPAAVLLVTLPQHTRLGHQVVDWSPPPQYRRSF